jgi:hypothetical protein
LNRTRTWRWQGYQPYAPAVFTLQGKTLVLISVRSWVDHRATVQPERLGQWKISKTPSGMKSAAFWLVAQYLIQLRYCVPPQQLTCSKVL